MIDYDFDMNDHVHESNLIEGIDDWQAQVTGMLAWSWLKRQTTIDNSTLRYLHFLVTIAQDDIPDKLRGCWRDVPVRVGTHVVTSEPHIISQYLYAWCVRLERAVNEPRFEDTPRVLHVEFEKIHPFIDGNGRTGRLLMWWHELRLGQTPTLLRADERWTYYEWFRG